MDVDQLNDSSRNVFAVATWNNTHGPFWIKLDPKSQTSSLLNDFIEGFRNLPAIGHTLPWRHGWICSTLVVVAFLGNERMVKWHEHVPSCPPKKGSVLTLNLQSLASKSYNSVEISTAYALWKWIAVIFKSSIFWINSCISYHLGYLVKGAGGS